MDGMVLSYQCLIIFTQSIFTQSIFSPKVSSPSPPPQFESLFLNPVLQLWDEYSVAVGEREVSEGLQDRLWRGQGAFGLYSDCPFVGMKDDNDVEWERSSVIFAVLDSSMPNDQDLVSAVELRLQPTDAKVPFSFPLLDFAERKIASLIGRRKGDRNSDTSDEQIQPYLSNLWVAPSHRRLGLGRRLCEVAVEVAGTIWQDFDGLFLHVDPKNEEAVSLYESCGWKKMEKRWTPGWEGGASRIDYYRRPLRF